MYSATISPRSNIRSDGQLHPSRAPQPPAPPPKQEAPVPRKAMLGGISSEQVLIMVIAYLLLQSDKPDWLLVLALVYILF